MDNTKKASILYKRLVSIIAIAIFAFLALFLKDSADAKSYTFTFHGWTKTFENSSSERTVKWDVESGSYCYMTYGKSATASTVYRTKWVTITPDAVDKYHFGYENGAYWTEASHIYDQREDDGYTYTLLSIKKETLNNILKARCGKTLDQLATQSPDRIVTVYLQSSHIFLIGGVREDNNGGMGYYNYQMSWDRANALGFSPGEYFTGYNVPIKLEVPKKVNLYLQSYTSDAGGDTYTKITSQGYKQIKYASETGRTLNFNVDKSVTFNSISKNGDNDVVNIPTTYQSGDRIYFLQKVLVKATSNKDYPKTIKPSYRWSSWNAKMDSPYQRVANYAAGDTTNYDNNINTIKNTTIPTDNAGGQGNLVVRAIYTSVKRNLTVNFYEVTKSNNKYNVPKKPNNTKRNALTLYHGDKLTIKINHEEKAEKKGDEAKYVGPTKYKDSPIYQAVLSDSNDSVLKQWPVNTDALTELYRASGYTKQYSADLSDLKKIVFKNSKVKENYTLDLYYVAKDKATINVKFRYLDSNGEEVQPDGLPTSLPPTTEKIGNLWKLSSVSKANFSQGLYYYDSYYATYYVPSGLKATLMEDRDGVSFASSDDRIRRLQDHFSNLKKSKRYEVYGDINVTITYKSTVKPKQISYTVNKHYLDRNGNQVHVDTSTLTKSENSTIKTNVPASSYYNNKDYAWSHGQSTGSLEVPSTNDRNQLDQQIFKLKTNTTLDIYYRETTFYTVTAHWYSWDKKVELKPAQVIDKIEEGNTFLLKKYKAYFEATNTYKGIIRNRQSGTISMKNGASELTGKYTFEMMDSFDRISTMLGNVDLYFYYISQVPVHVKYVYNGTDISKETVLLYSKPEETTCIVRDYEEFSTKIANRGYITVNGTRYKYNKHVKFTNFKSGNLERTDMGLTAVGNSKITLPKTGSGKTPTITLYYNPMADLIVRYVTKDKVTGEEITIKENKEFENAITPNQVIGLGGNSDWVKAYQPEDLKVNGYSLDETTPITIDFKGDTNPDELKSTIDALKATSITPTKDVTVTIYYKSNVPKELRVQRIGTDNREIAKTALVKQYANNSERVYLNALQNANTADQSGNHNWLTNNPTELGFTAYEYAGKIGIVIDSGVEQQKNFTLADVANQYLDGVAEKILIKIYYRPKYNLTINYYEKGSTTPVMPEKTYNMGFYNESFSLGALDSSFLPETINNMYSYTGQYQWDGGNIINGDMNQVRSLGQANLTSNHTLNLYYEAMPTTYTTIYVVDEATSTVLTTTDTIQQNSQRQTLEKLYAGNDMGTKILTNDLLNLSDYGLGSYIYQGKYRVEKRTQGQSYDPLKVPTVGLVSADLATVRQTNVYSKTESYDVYLYYKRSATVEVVYVNAETGIVEGHKPVEGALVGGRLSINADLVTEQYTITGFSGERIQGSLVGYNKSDNGTYDAGCAPDDYTNANRQQILSSGVLIKETLANDYYVYLYYKIPSKITIHYYYNGEERTDMSKVIEMIPVKDYRVPEEHVYPGLDDGKLVAWEMSGAKDVDRKLINSVEEFMKDEDSLIPNADRDTDLNLYYRHLNPPTPEPVDQTTSTTKDSDVMDDAGNLDFDSSGAIYDDASDDKVDNYSEAKTYDLATENYGIAGGDKAESAVNTLKYGYAIKYDTYTSSRTFTIQIVDEVGAEIGEYTVDRNYLINKLDYFTILKAKDYQYRNAALDVTNNTVSGDYASHLQDVQSTFNNKIRFGQAAGLGTVADGSLFGGTTVLESKIGDTATDEVNPLTKQPLSINPTITIAVDTRKNPAMDFETATEGLVSNYDVDTDVLRFTNPFSAEVEDILNADGTTNHVQLTEKAADGDDTITSVITHLPVSKTVPNSEYPTDQCKIHYKNALAMTAGSNTPAYAFESYGAEPETDYEVNSVFVHTPVVLKLDATSTGLVNQSLNDYSDTQSAVSLGKDLVVSYSTIAEHKGATGYKYRDYSEYSDGKIYLVFPFEVLYNGTYYKANTKLVLNYDKDNPANNQIVVTVPTWTKTGNAVIKAYMYASNAVTEDQKQRVSVGGNYSMEDYVAVGQKYVTVLGNVYDFEIYDVSDYPLWHDVFRQANSLLFKTGSDAVTYKVGQRNWMTEKNDQKAEYTLPLMEGSHPTNKNEGTLGTGYAFRFKLKTTGSMCDENDAIAITPKFYFVAKDGSSRQEVDLYYNGTINGQKAALVKVGSDLDKKQQKSLTVGDEYLGIPESELADTAKLLGTSVQSLKAQTVDSYTFSSITLPSALRTFVGDKTVPAGAHVSAEDLQRSVQEWYGEYYLPSKLYVCAKGFDVKGYASSNGLNFSEEFWLKDGYIVVNFDIKTVDNGELSLSYNAGYPETVNMFKREGAVLSKAASSGTVYDLLYGDVVFYDRSKAAEDDYRSSGTH